MRTSTSALASVSVVIGLAATLLGQSAPPQLYPGDGPIPSVSCGTASTWEMAGRVRSNALPGGLSDGEPFTFDQDPPILFPDYTGSITLRNFSVVGDYETVQFFRFTRAAPDGKAESWTRARSRSVNGQIISVFEPSWPNDEWEAALSFRRIGFDRPYMYWGAFQLPGRPAQRSVYLRAGFHGIPASPVVRINDQVQYASNVVNLVAPTFDDARVTGGGGAFDIASATQLFYQHFADAYDVIALTSQSVPVGDFGAFHRNVRNSVTGLNLSTFDVSRNYGSRGVLQGVEVYTGSLIARYEDTDHEMAHQWLSNFNWSAIANLTRAGHEPAAHSPLWTGGETLIGAVILGNRRVGPPASARYAIEQTPPPAHFHPLELYAMGLRTAREVPDFLLFADQGQFDDTTSVSPSLGTAVTGGTLSVSIDDVVRVHGSRQGPAISPTWRRASIVVSRDRLASQQEMDYWNFFAQRLADRNHASRPGFDNYVSFRRATNDAVDVATAITPLAGSPLPQTLDVDTPTFGAGDWRDLSITPGVPSRIAAGQPLTLTGRVTARDAVDFSSVTLGFWALNASSAINFSGSVNRTRDFSVTVFFSPSQRGIYYMANYLFWPGSGSQFPRGSVSTIVVE